MQLTLFKNTVLLFLFLGISCRSGNDMKSKNNAIESETIANTSQTETLNNKTLEHAMVNKTISVGANQTKAYLALLEGKRVGIVANQTSVISNSKETQQKRRPQLDLKTETKTVLYTHLVDSLIALNINIKKVFAPEHGFRGTADAGEVVKDGLDTKTRLPIISLYGKNKKPSNAQLANLDVVIFDIQDVGARFYTYISSLHYVMEACAENNVPIIVLDRPNPNGHIIDGPILELEHKSFVGMHPIPVVHGMTIGEYAKMINGERWLKNNVKCNLTVVKLKNYTHDLKYSLPISPSPNLPNSVAINLYSSLCFFEGTSVSVGRGTNLQFQVYGSPFLPKTNFSFIPKPNLGAKYPKHENKVCYGFNLRKTPRLNTLDLSFLINAYTTSSTKNKFFNTNGFFTKLAGTKQLQQQIEAGKSEAEIKATWKNGLDNFKITRSKYLLYK